MTHLTGLIPDRPHSRLSDRSEHLYQSTVGSDSPVICQLVSPIRRQFFPCCAGECLAAGIDYIEIPEPIKANSSPYASGISIWREARRRQGKIEQVEEGTRLEHAVSGLVFRGYDLYQPGEERDYTEAGLGAPDAGDDLYDEMFADDHRIDQWIRYRILIDALDSVDSALGKGYGVVIGTGTRPSYHEYRGDPDRVDRVLTTSDLGGDSGGHGQRVVGRIKNGGKRVYLIQNSWGQDWGGCHLPDNTYQPGCCWVTEEVLRFAWDIHVIGKRI